MCIIRELIYTWTNKKLRLLQYKYKKKSLSYVLNKYILQKYIRVIPLQWMKLARMNSKRSSYNTNPPIWSSLQFNYSDNFMWKQCNTIIKTIQNSPPRNISLRYWTRLAGRVNTTPLTKKLYNFTKTKVERIFLLFSPVQNSSTETTEDDPVN